MFLRSLLIALFLAPLPNGNPTGYSVDEPGEHLTALDSDGNALWEITFTQRDAVTALDEQAFDVDGDGVSELLAATRSQNGRGAALLVIDTTTRKVRWRFDAPGLATGDPKSPIIHPAGIDRDKVSAGMVNGKRVIAFASAFPFAFSRLHVLDAANGKPVGEFLNPGSIASVRVLDVGKGVLAIWGVANQFDPKDVPDFAASLHPYFFALWTAPPIAGTAPKWPHTDPKPHNATYIVAPLPLPMLETKPGRDNYRGEGSQLRNAIIETAKAPDGKPAIRWLHPDGRELFIRPDGTVASVSSGAVNLALLAGLGKRKADGEAALSKEALLIFESEK